MAIYYTVNKREKYHDYESKEDVVNYILNPFKIHNGYVGFMNVDPRNPALSMHQCSAAYGKDKGIQIRHFVVSFGVGEIKDSATANAIAQELLLYIGSLYPTFYAVHEDKENIHFHMAFNNIGLTGQRYHGTKAEYYAIINALKSILRKYGIYVLQLKYYK
ncbi:MAG: relaxase/mobilization nuclease domain-containing protein [Clostridia bacterium]|nr:relaxase/mobilization nuclease domain-containing protein [Clostridia bacterium]